MHVKLEVETQPLSNLWVKLCLFFKRLVIVVLALSVFGGYGLFAADVYYSRSRFVFIWGGLAALAWSLIATLIIQNISPESDEFELPDYYDRPKILCLHCGKEFASFWKEKNGEEFMQPKCKPCVRKGY